MKLAIITVIVSILSMTECDGCGKSHFLTTSGCKECFCSGVTDQCYGNSFSTDTITGLDGIYGEVYDENLQTWLPAVLENDGSEVQYRFVKDKNATFHWYLPSKYITNGARIYGGRLNLTHKITPIPGAQRNDVIRVHLKSDKLSVYLDVQPIASSGNYQHYSIPLFESSWYVIEEDWILATRNHMMRLFISLRNIYISIYEGWGRDAVSISDISMDVAVNDVLLDSPQTDLIEICDCPEAYVGDSCELCSNLYERNVKNKTESVFGACEPMDLKLPGSVY